MINIIEINSRFKRVKFEFFTSADESKLSRLLEKVEGAFNYGHLLKGSEVKGAMISFISPKNFDRFVSVLNSEF